MVQGANTFGVAAGNVVEVCEAGASFAARWGGEVYAELHKVAAACMRRERAHHTLQPTALVHEVYLRLLRQGEREYQDKAHFLGVAAHMMRLILIDSARTRLAEKRGGGAARIEVTESLADHATSPELLVSVDRALEQLAHHSPRQVQIVEMRFFAGLDESEIGVALGVSLRTVKRDWRLAKAFLYRSLQS